MPKNIRLQDYFHEIKVFQNRSVVALVMSIVLMSILFARLYYLQIIKNQHYSTLSTNNRVTIQAIPPIRGLIYDTKGEVLAENIPSFNLHLIPEKVKNLSQTLELLSTIVNLDESDIKRFNRQVKRKHRFESVPIKFHLSDEEVAILAVNRHRLPGVEVEAQLSRHYPYGKETAHVVGYVGRINEKELKKLVADGKTTNYSGTNYIGKLGVEKSYEQELLGKVGFQQVETDVRGRVLRVLKRTDPIPGKDLYLNIDIKLQQVAMKAFGDENGALVAIDPNNGDVLSMVSMPSYDANLFVNGIGYKAYKELNTSEARPLFNRAILGSYPPGSTTKPFLALAGLELDDILADEEIYCPGFYRLKGKQHKYRDWKKWGHGKTDMHKAIVQSCDVYFYSLAYRLGIDKMYHFMSLFGFGQRSGIDIPGERGGLMPSRKWKRKAKGQAWFPGETLITGIGQGYMLVTPVQLAAAVAALAHKGLLYQPQLLKSISVLDASGKTLQQSVEASLTSAIPLKNKANWRFIAQAMKDVIHSNRGTARRLDKKGMAYTIAGKTGTAQVFTVAQDSEYKEKELEKKLRDHALFVAFAPVENSQISIAVIVENGGHGGSVAAPIAGKVIEYYLTNKRLKSESLKNKKLINNYSESKKID
ncbi:MAG: penicillin-binding protein 2 [Pseudomonadota bacterium]